jgi:hypothetical protein
MRYSTNTVKWYSFLGGVSTTDVKIPNGVSWKLINPMSNGTFADKLIIQVVIPLDVNIYVESYIHPHCKYTSLLPTAFVAGPVDQFYSFEVLGYDTIKVTIDNTTGVEQEGNIGWSLLVDRR